MRLLTFVLILLCTFLSFAQKSNVVLAQELLIQGEFAQANTSITEACKNDKTRTLSTTWIIAGDVNLAIAKSEQSQTNSAALAFVAYRKALLLDVKGNDQEEIKSKILETRNVNLLSANNAFQNEDYNLAVMQFEQCLEMAEYCDIVDNENYFMAAQAASKAGFAELGIAYAQICIDNNYGESKPFILLAELYQQKEQPERALMAINEGERKFPSNIDLILQSITAHLSVKDYLEAQGRLKRAMHDFPNESKLHFTAGVLYDKIEQPDKAEKYYLTALELDPLNVQANFNLGTLYLNDEINKVKRQQSIEGLNKAIPYLEKSSNLEPKNVVYRKTLIEAYTIEEQLAKLKAMEDTLSRIGE